MSADLNPLYGLWSITDRCWIGPAYNNALPLLYSDAVIKGRSVPGRLQAQAAATIMTERFNNKRQIIAKLYVGTPRRTTKTVTCDLDSIQAIGWNGGR